MSRETTAGSWATAGTTEIPRSRVLGYLRKAKPRAVLVSAPSGYGKTILATQISRLPRFSETVWVECGAGVATPEALFSRLTASTQCLADIPEHDIDGRSPTIADPIDSMAAIGSVLGRHSAPACVVLDDVCLGQLGSEIAELRSLVASAGTDHTLVVTTRSTPVDAMRHLRGFLVIDVEDLRLDVKEIGHLYSRASGASQSDDFVQLLFELSGGQVALASILARHAAMRGASFQSGIGSVDLKGLLLGLCEAHLASVEAQMLFTISILGRATRAELRSIRDEYESVDLMNLAQCIPLLRLRLDGGGRAISVAMHDLAQEVFAEAEFADRYANGWSSDVLPSCIRILEERRDYARLLPLLVENLSQTEFIEWLLVHGSSVAACGYGLALGQALETLPATVLLAHPRLLLMTAEFGPAASEAGERLARASAARDLAACEDDASTVADALIAKASALKDMGRIRQAGEALEELLNLPSGTVSEERYLLSAAHLITQRALFFETDKVIPLRDQLAHAVEQGQAPEAVQARVYAQLASAEYCLGNTCEAARFLMRAGEVAEIPIVLRATVLGNLSNTLTDMGRLARAKELSDEHQEISTGYGLETHHDAGRATQSDIGFFLGSEKVALDSMREGIASLQRAGDRLTATHARVRRASLLRCVGEIDAAMSDVEAAIEYSTSQGIGYHRYLAEVELAANFLALGDLQAAARHASRVREACAPLGAMHQVFRADMVLAEVARRQGRTEEAVNRFLEHEEYILEDNVNYPIAVYTRAFPALLCMLAAAIGVERLPAYLLRMVTGESAEDALIAGRGILDDAQWRTLASRLFGDGETERIELLSKHEPCRVRLFGGFEVRVGSREIPETAWSKRKSRVLFAMLVLQHGRDLSRECVYEHLWPEMTETRARNNLYVTWSNMKGALLPGASRDVPCPYVSHKGGVCRVSTALVSSDVAQFDTLFNEARTAEAEGDSARALRAYEGLVDVYRGELLPGDVYDDWFAAARDRYRQDFGDAMRAAHRLLTEREDHASALRLVRRGIAVDSWREDLYQAALSSQITLGHRGAAVETYLACRTRLAEELGLDPSGETVRLYEQVLAMEDGPSHGLID